MRPILVGTLVALLTTVLPTGAIAPTTPELVAAVTGRDLRPSSDFNGDGFADLALKADGPIDTPGDALQIVYGSHDGLSPLGQQYWTETQLAGMSGGESSFASALAVGDFNGDGFDDLAVGHHGADVGDARQAGAVLLLPGSSRGLDIDRTQRWTQDRAGVRGRAESGDNFGFALAAGDFDGSGEDDLAVGAPGENDNAGAVNVLPGSPQGLGAADDQLWSQGSGGVPGRGGRFFGSALAAGPFSGGRYADLAVGVPYADVGDDVNAGAVNVLRGSAKGLTARQSQLWTQDSPGIPGSPWDEERFGASLAVGHFAGRAAADLAIGIPGEFYLARERVSVGAVVVLYGSSRGLTSRGSQVWSQATEGIVGTPEEQDEFGHAVAAGDFGRGVDGRRFDDLAVGVPGEDESAGAVHILYGGPGGLGAQHSRRLTEDTPGVPGDLQQGDEFGSAVAAADFGGFDDHDDLAVGVPVQSLPTAPQYSVGAVNVIYGGRRGLPGIGGQVWDPRALGRTGHEEVVFGTSGSGFGQVLAGG